jgi:hypothetical protein
MNERHEKAFGQFDMRLSVEADGDMWISFCIDNKCVLTMTWEELREILDFAAVHGLKMQQPYLVEYNETVEGAMESADG